MSERIYIKFGHRNFTHSLLFAVLTSGLVLPLRAGNLAVLGILSHILTDALTYVGVPLFWPFNSHFVILGGKLSFKLWMEITVILLSLGVILLC